MPDLAKFHGPIVVLHVLGVLLFALAPGVSAAVLLRIRSERDPAALRTLLDLSRRSMNVMGVGFLVWFLSGVLAGFSGNWLDQRQTVDLAQPGHRNSTDRSHDADGPHVPEPRTDGTGSGSQDRGVRPTGAG